MEFFLIIFIIFALLFIGFFITAFLKGDKEEQELAKFAGAWILGIAGGLVGVVILLLRILWIPLVAIAAIVIIVRFW